jgi:hypothetical protein
MERCQSDLPHLVGQVLTDVVVTCFEFDLRTEGLDEYTTQVYFQKGHAAWKSAPPSTKHHRSYPQ